MLQKTSRLQTGPATINTVDDLAQWMANTRIDPHLRNMICRYLLAQSKKTMSENGWRKKPSEEDRDDS